jgi:DnaJ-class molecular chaperone
MVELKYFEGVKTERAITKRYRELAKKYHPDNANSDDELNNFTETMKEVNAEHQEVLVLLKHKAFATVEAKQEKTKNNLQTSDFVRGVTSLFALTNEQKQVLGEHSKNFVNTLIDSFVQNNLKK